MESETLKRRIWTSARITRLSVAAVAVYIAMGAVLLATAKNGFDALGIPLGFDFLAFHGGGRMALEGRLSEAFDPHQFQAVLEQQVPGLGFGYYWLYPPAFGVMVAPFGALPYGVAFWAWTGIGIVAYAAGALTLSGSGRAVLAAFAFSASWVAAYHGQNAFFVCALTMAAFHLLLRNRDAWAGVCIGLLVIKPHLAVLFPLALAIAGRWRAFSVAGVTALGVTALSAAILGADYWSAYLATGFKSAGVVLETPHHWATISSVYVSFRLLGTPIALAGGAHGVVALAAAAMSAAAFRRDGVTRETLALLAAATLLISPYVMDYDLLLLASTGLLLFTGRNRDLGDGAGTIGFLIALAPILVVGLGREGLQIGWLAPVAAMLLARRSIYVDARSRAALGAK